MLNYFIIVNNWLQYIKTGDLEKPLFNHWDKYNQQKPVTSVMCNPFVFASKSLHKVTIVWPTSAMFSFYNSYHKNMYACMVCNDKCFLSKLFTSIQRYMWYRDCNRFCNKVRVAAISDWCALTTQCK